MSKLVVFIPKLVVWEKENPPECGFQGLISFLPHLSKNQNTPASAQSGTASEQE